MAHCIYRGVTAYMAHCIYQGVTAYCLFVLFGLILNVPSTIFQL